MRPIQTFHVLENLRDCLSVPLMRKGSVLSDSDSRTVRDVYIQWMLLLLDLGFLTPDLLERDSRRLWISLIHADVYDLNNTFTECLHLVRMKNIRGFKGLCSRISPHLYSLIKDDIGRMSQGDISSARRLTQLFSYTSRLSLRDLDLTQQLLEDYREIEANVPRNVPDGLVRQLSLIIKRWIKPFCPVDQIVPRHGPGAVAGQASKAKSAKYKNLATDQLLEYAFGDPYWVEHTPDSSQRLRRQSKTIFVPKSYKTFRTISMEPATLQYFQQGVWGVIDRQVSRSRYLKARIGFHDQERNKLMAREGSIVRNYATLDLSSASDSVGYELIKRLFRGTWLLRFIVATRSRETSFPDRTDMPLAKFAPMGSALCFPIETLVFAAICEHVTRECGVSGDYSVFGDDIIVPTLCVDMTVRCLTNLGFKVNTSKSFYQSDCWFRESCGGEYFDGHDATPMRVSRKYASVELNVRIQELTDLSNAAYIRGFRNLRYFFIQKILESTTIENGKPVSIVPLFSPTSLLSDNYTNYRAKRRWNPRLQRIEVRVHQERSSYSQKDLADQDESVRYRHWLETTVDRLSIGDGFQSVICMPTTSILKTWVEKPYELPDQEFIDFNLGRGQTKPL